VMRDQVPFDCLIGGFVWLIDNGRLMRDNGMLMGDAVSDSLVF
jgi:hypothetical protein